jgi:hypothetical protein
MNKTFAFDHPQYTITVTTSCGALARGRRWCVRTVSCGPRVRGATGKANNERLWLVVSSLLAFHARTNFLFFCFPTMTMMQGPVLIKDFCRNFGARCCSERELSPCDFCFTKKGVYKSQILVQQSLTTTPQTLSVYKTQSFKYEPCIKLQRTILGSDLNYQADPCSTSTCGWVSREYAGSN